MNTKFNINQDVFVINTQQVKKFKVKSIFIKEERTEYLLENKAKYTEDTIGATKEELKKLFFN